jgi:hypothetical protein
MTPAGEGARKRPPTEVPYAEGPTGSAPLATEYHGDPGAEGDRQAEGGAVGGVVAGTAVAGPVGGVIGGVVGATIGTAAEEGSDVDAETEENPVEGSPELEPPSATIHVGR